MRKIVLTHIWGTTCFTVPKLVQLLRISSALKTEKKLNAKSLKILICMAQIFPTSQQDIYDYSSSNVHKFILNFFFFLAHCIWPFIQNKSHVFWNLQGNFLEGDIKVLKYVSRCKLSRRKGWPPVLFFENWLEWSCLLGKMPRLRGSMGKFIIKILF